MGLKCPMWMQKILVCGFSDPTFMTELVKALDAQLPPGSSLTLFSHHVTPKRVGVAPVLLSCQTCCMLLPCLRLLLCFSFALRQSSIQGCASTPGMRSMSAAYLSRDRSLLRQQPHWLQRRISTQLLAVQLLLGRCT